MAAAPVASPTVKDVLAQLDSDFSAVADAFENGEFALWVGSGISRQSPNLGGLIGRAIEYLRVKALDVATQAEFKPAFDEALALAEADLGLVQVHFATPFANWPEPLRNSITNRLWNKYSALLDIRIEGRDDDFILWEAIDIRDAFANPKPPAAEHLCIAILILEGALTQIASANWDGFIEAAVDRLGPGRAGNLQVVVDPDQMREGAAKAQLFKFHGCIVYASQDPTHFRKFLTGSETQINGWATEPLFKPMVNRVTAIATEKKAMMVGLSLQDVNLQILFTNARQAHPWPWPCAPAAQGHVFCEEGGLGPKQIAMLKTVYAANYNANIAAIKASALIQSWPEKVLLALTLRLLADKLAALLGKRLEGMPLATSTAYFGQRLAELRDTVAQAAAGDHTDFVNGAIASWTRLVSVFRDGKLPDHPASYAVINTSAVAHVANDANAIAAGFGDLAIILGLLQDGQVQGNWSLFPPPNGPLSEGALVAKGLYNQAEPRPIFIVRSAGEAIKLQQAGALNDNSVVIHGDDLWEMINPGGAQPLAAPRGRKRAPGRTGRSSTQHVCLKRLLEKETTLDGIQKRFVGEVAL